MDQIHRIRMLYYEQGKNLKEIAALTDLDWRTVRKYVDQEDFSPARPSPEKEEQHESKLNTFKPLIDGWLTSDLKAPRKQRHTAKRIHKRLQKEAEGYSCSYRLLVEYVSRRKKELRLTKQEGYLPLIHFPGEAQADFGTADFYENGRLHHGAKYLVLSFPYSNGGYLQLNYGENMIDAGKAGNSLYKTQLAAMEQILTGASDISDEVGNTKITDPVNSGNVLDVESWYSWNSIADFTDNIRSVRNAYYGSLDGSVNNNSMAAYMNKVNATLDGNVRTAIDNALKEVSNMPAPFRNHLSKSETQKAVDACNNLLDALDAAIEAIE